MWTYNPRLPAKVIPALVLVAILGYLAGGGLSRAEHAGVSLTQAQQPAASTNAVVLEYPTPTSPARPTGASTNGWLIASPANSGAPVLGTQWKPVARFRVRCHSSFCSVCQASSEAKS